MKDSVVDLDCNVIVRSIDRHGRVVREVKKHNKATVNLVDGILRFLKGDFSNTEYNQGDITPDEAEMYLPVRAEFGRIGVKITEDSNPMNRRFDYIDTDEFVQPTFDSSALQEPIEFSDHTLLKFRRISQTSYYDNNNSECLEFSLYINPGKLVGYNEDRGGEGTVFTPYDWSYYNPSIGEYETMLTEVGLFSSSNVLLARVLFDAPVVSEEYFGDTQVSQGKYPVFSNPSDENNPITQSESTTIVLIWRIGIMSVGKNDTMISESSMGMQQFMQQFSQWFVDYITEVTGESQEDWNKGYTPSRIRNDIQNEINELLSGRSLLDVAEE